jgi:hypothetical protein
VRERGGSVSRAFSTFVPSLPNHECHRKDNRGKQTSKKANQPCNRVDAPDGRRRVCGHIEILGFYTSVRDRERSKLSIFRLTGISKGVPFSSRRGVMSNPHRRVIKTSDKVASASVPLFIAQIWRPGSSSSQGASDLPRTNPTSEFRVSLAHHLRSPKGLTQRQTSGMSRQTRAS